MPFSRIDLQPGQRRKTDFGEPNEDFSDAVLVEEMKRKGSPYFLSVPKTWIFLLLLSMFACGGPYDWTQERDFSEGGWEIQDTIQVEYNNTTAGIHKARIGLSLSPDLYLYSNLWLKLITTSPSGEQTEQKINNVLMTQMGEWNKEIKMGKVEWLVEPAPELNLTETGTYTFKLTQFMREEALAGVLSVGMMIE